MGPGSAARTALLAVALIGGGCQNLQTPVPMLEAPPEPVAASWATPGAGSGAEAGGIPAPEVLVAAALNAFAAAKAPPGGVRPAGAPDVIHATATAAFRAAIAPAVARGFTSAAASTAALSAAAHAAAKATAVVLGRDTSIQSAYAIVGAITNEAHLAASAAGYPGYPTGQNFEGAATAGLSEVLGFGFGVSQAVATAAPRGAGGGSGGGRPTAPRKEFTLVGVLYATDRKPLMPLADWKRDFPNKNSNYAYFGGDPEVSGRLHFGLCTVSVPISHKPGSLERPEWLRTENLVTHITIRGLFELDEADMRRRITTMSAPDNDVFIFIHGFNVKFNEAAMRAAQIAYDFKFLGAPILYSWSSAGTLEGYQHDQENVSLTGEKLLEFVESVVRERGAGKVHLIAHSMGNRALVAVLKELAKKGSGKLFGEVVLAAPDVPLGAFRATDADNVRKLADRISLYASSDDKALKLSQAASTHARLGLSGKDLFVMSGIDTIDASGVDTDLLSLSHTYFANSRKVLDDLAAVLVHRARPDAAPRKLFRKMTPDNKVYWAVIK